MPKYRFLQKKIEKSIFDVIVRFFEDILFELRYFHFSSFSWKEENVPELTGRLVLHFIEAQNQVYERMWVGSVKFVRPSK